MSERLERIIAAESRLKKLLNPQVEVERPTIPPGTSPEQLLGELLYRTAKLEAQNQALLKIIWRTSATILGLVLAGPAKDWLDLILKSLGVW